MNEPSDVEAGELGSTIGDLEVTASTTLVEVTPGVAVLFGEVPEGVELIDLDLIPSFDRELLSSVLGSVGNVGTIAGNVAEAVASAQGLYRVNEATLALLKSGAKLATKDGANIGTMLKNGQIVAQARFIPHAITTATAIAAIGPAVSMLALQMQLGEIGGLVRTNIALTTQTLRSIRHEQWSEMEGLAESVEEALLEARELGVVTDTVWEPIAPSGPVIRKQLNLFRRNVTGHVTELRRIDGRAKRHYLEANAEAIVAETHLLVRSLKTYAEYEALRAALARARSASDENEAQLFSRIIQSIPAEIEESFREIGEVTESLVRELRIIAELPGRATVPLSRKRQDAKAAKLTCAQLLEAIEPLANMLFPQADAPLAPDTVCAPKNLDLDPYLKVLRWFLEDGEQLRGIAFPYVARAHSLIGAVPAILAKRVDATWEALSPGRAGDVVGLLASSTFIAVTDRRILSAPPRMLLQRGELGDTFLLDEVRYVRPRTNHGGRVRPTISITTERDDVQWIFPAGADHQDIDDLGAVIERDAAQRQVERAALDSPNSGLGSPLTR